MLAARIQMEDWNKHERDPDISCFYEARHELFVVDDLILRINKIVISTSLRRKVIKAAHLEHLGMTKTKQMLKENFWFPSMNVMVEQIIGQCYECSVTTKQHRQEPVKVTDIPKKLWDVIAIDFGGSYPDGHYNLVAIDKWTRYPEVAKTHSTAAKPTTERLKTMFATHPALTPKNLQILLILVRQRDFIITTSLQNMHVAMEKLKVL